MKIVAARITVVGTPWRELVFLELEADSGLVGNSTGGRIKLFEEGWERR